MGDIVPVEIDINGPDPEVVDDNDEEDDSDENEGESKGADLIHREAPVTGVLKIWFGGVRIDLPSAADLNSRKMRRLTPRDCGAAEADICVSIATTASGEERPDGGSCGLLNHLSIGCESLTHDDPCLEAIEGSASKEGTSKKGKVNKTRSKNTSAKDDGRQNSRENLSGILVNLGMIPLGTADGAEGLERAAGPSASTHLDVLVDGIPVGILPVPSAKRAAADLRCQEHSRSRISPPRSDIWG